MSKIKCISSFTIIVAFICVALIGVAFIPLLPVKLAPSRTLPGLTISFTMPGNSARVIEMEVTGKLEAMLARIRGIKNIYSTSSNGTGNITIEMDKHTDIDAVRFEASTIVRQTWPELPGGVGYPTIRMRHPDQSASRPFMTYTLIAPATPIYILQYAEDNIKNRLAHIPGIYKIDLSGATPMEWRLYYNNDQLVELGIAVSDIRNAVAEYYNKEFLGTYNLEAGGGKEEWIRLTVSGGNQGGAIFDPALIQVTLKEGKMITLSQLVKVVYTEEDPQSYYRINGLNSIYLSLTAEDTANQLQLSSTIKETIARIRATLPPDYQIHTSYDATEYIQQELDKIYLRTILTVVILLVFVFIITLKPKYLFLIVTSLAINISIAVIFYYLFGLEMQLYSLAGITVSLNLVIDNTIVMTDHLLNRRNLKAFVAILAATLTTMGALVIIFSLDEKIRLNLQDFAAVMMINLGVSLFVALFFVPAMIDKTGLKKHGSRKKRAPRLIFKRGAVYFTRAYRWLIVKMCRFRVIACFLLILAFGLPVFMLPDKVEGDGKLATAYNKVLGTGTYKESVKPVVDKVLGGSLRLFIQKVYEGSYFTRNEELVLSIAASLPSGSTLEQMNNLIKRMETYLSEFSEIRQFQASVYSANRAGIEVYFKKEFHSSGFPYILKARVINRALELGGGSWSVYGLPDQGFNNSVRENAGSFRIKMYGYNYDELSAWADSLKSDLLTYRRIKDVIINSEFSWYKDDYEEFSFSLNRERLARENINSGQLYRSLQPVFLRGSETGVVSTVSGIEKIKLYSTQSERYDIWSLENYPYYANDKWYKLSELTTIERGQSSRRIAKENQQYRLCLQYDYIGAYEQGKKITASKVEEFNEFLPMGYTAELEEGWSWGKKENKQYLLLLVVIAIIFFITGILFNSIKRPLAIIFIIPISYIGVFLTFYWFRLNFDQGGFASFVLLCGITVNASIYIISEFNSIRRNKPALPPLVAYTKAWNAKVVPIFLTVVSTVLGFIPFMIGEEKEAFWFPLGAGTIGGLMVSVLGIFLFLPVFTLKKEKRKKRI